MQCLKMVTGVLFMLLAVAAAKEGDKPNMAPIPVTIYYESLCPDSIKFITKQFYPAYQTFGPKVIDVTLIPYGKSKYEKSENGSLIFECHHGPYECFGNTVQACALTYLTSLKDRVDFVYCVMDTVKVDKKDSNDKYPGPKCASKLGLSFTETARCANTTEGEQELYKQALSTEKFQNQLKSVPTVVFNNVFDKDVSDKAQKNFAGVLCGYLGGPKGNKECKNSGVANQATILFAVVAAIFLKVVS